MRFSYHFIKPESSRGENLQDSQAIVWIGDTTTTGDNVSPVTFHDLRHLRLHGSIFEECGVDYLSDKRRITIGIFSSGLEKQTSYEPHPRTNIEVPYLLVVIVQGCDLRNNHWTAQSVCLEVIIHSVTPEKCRRTLANFSSS